jgi:preprotein translocase subunit SecE
MEFLRKAREFVREVVVEFKRVSWPTRREVMGSTSVVVVMVLILAVFLAAVDNALSWLVGLVLR